MSSSSYVEFRVKLAPTHDAHVQYLSMVKMLTEDEANAVRNMIKGHLGKTVGKVGVGGEEYEILSSCPNIRDVHTFFSEKAKSKWTTFESYFHEKFIKKTTATATATATTTTTATTTATTTYQCSPAMATCDGLYPPPM